jgi:hypothetical protein
MAERDAPELQLNDLRLAWTIPCLAWGVRDSPSPPLRHLKGHGLRKPSTADDECCQPKSSPRAVIDLNLLGNSGRYEVIIRCV